MWGLLLSYFSTGKAYIKNILCVLLETVEIVIAFSCVPTMGPPGCNSAKHVTTQMPLVKIRESQNKKEARLWERGEEGRRERGRKGGWQGWEGDKGNLRVRVNQMFYTHLCCCQRTNLANKNIRPMNHLLASVPHFILQHLATSHVFLLLFSLP